MAFLVLGISLGAFIALLIPVEFSLKIPHVPYFVYGTEAVHEYASPSIPVRLVIPRIKLDTPIEETLGVTKEMTVEVPKNWNAIGWYRYGKTPGEFGASVLLGHVDSYRGPAQFFRLKELSPGDTIQVYRADGTVATFVVKNSETYNQDDTFPNEKVYLDKEGSSLRLVTCAGVYNHRVQRYSHNLVVYASLQKIDKFVH